MRLPRRHFVVWALLPWLVAGCRHKAAPPPPQVATAPPLPPSSMTQTPAVPKMPAPTERKVQPPGSDQSAQETPVTPPPKPRRKKRPAPADAAAGAAGNTAGNAQGAGGAAPAQAPPLVASAAAPAEPTLGQLSAGTGADSHERAAMNEQIHEQEVRLSKIKRPLNDEDEAITKQVEAFLSKAKQAVTENDLDGAQTLTTKAKVLLDELTHS